MSQKISKRVRADAVLICAIGASSILYIVYDAAMAVRGLATVSDAPDDPASRLATAAMLKARKRLGWGCSRQERCAEAEALLQTGWCP